MRAHTTVLVPLRALGVGKSRLAPRLSPAERAALAQAMFEDVIAAVRAVPVDEVVVAAGDESVARLGRSLDLRVHVDRPAVRSLDDAIADTVATLRPPGALLVVAADLPCISTADLEVVLAAQQPVVVAPTHDDGTAALLRRPADAIATSYGPRSATRHVQAAERAGLEAARLELPGLRQDVDTWQDLIALGTDRVGARTAAVIDELVPPATTAPR